MNPGIHVIASSRGGAESWLLQVVGLAAADGFGK